MENCLRTTYEYETDLMRQQLLLGLSYDVQAGVDRFCKIWIQNHAEYFSKIEGVQDHQEHTEQLLKKRMRMLSGLLQFAQEETVRTAMLEFLTQHDALIKNMADEILSQDASSLKMSAKVNQALQGYHKTKIISRGF